MKIRCFNPLHKQYRNYGGSGITVVKKWLIFDNFYNDMVISYQKELTLDRIDNTKNYSRENCRWATRKEQANNRKDNCLITYQGTTKTLQQWSDEKGIDKRTLRSRYVNGWSIDRLFAIVKV